MVIFDIFEKFLNFGKILRDFEGNSGLSLNPQQVKNGWTEGPPFWLGFRVMYSTAAPSRRVRYVPRKALRERAPALASIGNFSLRLGDSISRSASPQFRVR